MGNSAALQDAPPPPFDVMCSISLFCEAISSPYTVPSPILRGEEENSFSPSLSYQAKKKSLSPFPRPSPFLLSPSLSLLLPQKEGGKEREGGTKQTTIGKERGGKKEVLHNCPHSFFRPTPSLAPSSELQEGGRRGYAETPTRKFFSLPPLFGRGEEELAQCARRWAWREKKSVTTRVGFSHLVDR